MLIGGRTIHVVSPKLLQKTHIYQKLRYKISCVDTRLFYDDGKFQLSYFKKERLPIQNYLSSIMLIEYSEMIWNKIDKS